MPEVKFHFVKSPFHQELKVDGVYGGIGPTGNLHMSAYVERAAIPQVMTHQLLQLPNGAAELGPEVPDSREGKEGYVRIVQSTLHMDITQAKNLYRWLAEKIGEYDALVARQGGDEE